MMRREESRRELGSVKVQQPLVLGKAYVPAATPEQGGQGGRGTRRGKRGGGRLHGAEAEETAKSGRRGGHVRGSGSEGAGPAEGGGGSPRGGSIERRPSAQTR